LEVDKIYDELFRKYQKYTLRKNEIAKELGITPTTLRNLINNGSIDLPATTRGKKPYIPLKQVAEVIISMKGNVS
jgi:DNA invertase Pin-like site-specific DNA recombinase